MGAPSLALSLWACCLMYMIIVVGSSSSSFASVVDACRVAGGKKVCVCPAFGFDASSAGERAYAAVFEDALLREAGVVGARSATVEDVAALQPGVVVGFVKAVELRGDVSELQGIAQVLAESAGRKELLVALEIDPSADEGAQTAKVQALVAEAWALLPSSSSSSSVQDVEVTVVPVPRIGDVGAAAASIRSKLASIVAHDTPLLRTGTDVAAALSRRQNSGENAAEARAVAACSAVADAFMRDIRGRVASLTKGAMTASSGGGALPITDVAAAVAAALEDNYRVHAAVFAQHAGSDALKAASYQARAGLLALLQPLHRRAVESLRTGSMRVFDNVVLRVPPNRRLPQVLRAQAAAVQSNFALKAEELKTGACSAVDVCLSFLSVFCCFELPPPPLLIQRLRACSPGPRGQVCFPAGRGCTAVAASGAARGPSGSTATCFAAIWPRRARTGSGTSFYKAHTTRTCATCRSHRPSSASTTCWTREPWRFRARTTSCTTSTRTARRCRGHSRCSFLGWPTCRLTPTTTPSPKKAARGGKCSWTFTRVRRK